jgi:hypothetical protein
MRISFLHTPGSAASLVVPDDGASEEVFFHGATTTWARGEPLLPPPPAPAAILRAARCSLVRSEATACRSVAPILRVGGFLGLLSSCVVEWNWEEIKWLCWLEEAGVRFGAIYSRVGGWTAGQVKEAAGKR